MSSFKELFSNQYQGAIEEMFNLSEILGVPSLHKPLAASIKPLVSKESNLESIRSDLNRIGLQLQNLDPAMSNVPVVTQDAARAANYVKGTLARFNKSEND
ncbi:hypothetical protein P9112_012641 [Eukaryota sp. TZLM1-RC]